ncbi:MAG: hypothetical protein JOZ38_11345 [Candidatus Eremiobacteraeota bacterium]|nr:hypothetical protein [Candidatus Eremiobacteraeota bacterium]
MATRLMMCASVLMLCSMGKAAAQMSPSPSPAPSAEAPAAATPAPAPKPAHTASPLNYGGYVRSFYFTRTNTNPNPAKLNQPNAAAWQNGVKLHADYTFAGTPWNVGLSYFAATAFGANGTTPGFNARIDNTLPGYDLATLGEMYIQYHNNVFFGQTGKFQVNAPWLGPSDSRVKPVLFQGTWLSAHLTPSFNMSVYYLARFQSRVSSAFNSNTLLTSANSGYPYPGCKVPYVNPFTNAPAFATDPGDPCNTFRTTSGVLAMDLNQHMGQNLVVDVWNYTVYDLASMLYGTVTYNYAPKSFAKPFMAFQYVAENNVGKSWLGLVHNHTYGFQLGSNLVVPTVQWAFSLDSNPYQTYVTNNCASFVPGGVYGAVKGAAVAGQAGFNYCYGGSVASPYTNSYATDPLYTTSISQGEADTGLPGTSYKLAVTGGTNNKRLRVIVSDAYYDYTLPGQLPNVRKEFDADATWFFNPVRPGPYHGLSFRERYADRTTSNTSNSDFKYNRSQLEYDF